MTRAACIVALVVGCMACGVSDRGLVVNEVVVRNDDAWRDEWGQDDDYVELANASDRVIRTGGYTLTDASGARAVLPDRALSPGEVLLLVADAAPQQGALHLPFKLSASGEVLVLAPTRGFASERVDVPALLPNEAYVRVPSARGAFVRCATLSPGAPNPSACESRAQQTVAR